MNILTSYSEINQGEISEGDDICFWGFNQSSLSLIVEIQTIGIQAGFYNSDLLSSEVLDSSTYFSSFIFELGLD